MSAKPGPLRARKSKFYQVNKIVDKQKTKSGIHYLINWKHYSCFEDSWEPEENLKCDNLIKKFNNERAKLIKKKKRLAAEIAKAEKKIEKNCSCVGHVYEESTEDQSSDSDNEPLYETEYSC